jgi:hypothetical protein
LQQNEIKESNDNLLSSPSSLQQNQKEKGDVAITFFDVIEPKAKGGSLPLNFRSSLSIMGVASSAPKL